MSQVNRPLTPVRLSTFEGAPGRRLQPFHELRRAVASCLLWEDSFYESGQSIADRIKALVNGPDIAATDIMALAIEAREQFKLRHVPLLLVRELLRFKGPKHGLADTIARVIQRPDEITELLAIYWSDAKGLDGRRRMLPKQLKKGLAKAFQKFNAYSLAKYNRDNAVKLRDALFLCHPRPICVEATEMPELGQPINKPSYKRGSTLRHYTGQGAVWTQLVNNQLPAPDTWEVELSAGKDKRETFERLLREQKLGDLALLRNLRNMAEAHVDTALVYQAFANRKWERILPYRFIAAARAAPQFEGLLDGAMQVCMTSLPKLSGRTIVLVDGSGSMRDKLSAKSDLTRFDAACGLAILARGLSNDGGCEVMVFSVRLFEVPSRQGMALRDAIASKAEWSGTNLGAAVTYINQFNYDRLIVVTDEQSHDSVPAPRGQGYMLNVASYQPSIAFGPWVSISGWSESSIRFIQEYEKL